MIDGSPVVAVFRPGIILPLAVLTGVVVLLVLDIGVAEPLIFPLAIAAWVVGSLPIFVSRGVAVIFTTDSFLVKRPLRRTITIPLRSIKSARIESSLLRIQLLIGGEMSWDVPDVEAVVYLLNKAAGQGLQVTPYAALRQNP